MNISDSNGAQSITEFDFVELIKEFPAIYRPLPPKISLPCAQQQTPGPY